jgi:hypothetical protein
MKWWQKFLRFFLLTLAMFAVQEKELPPSLGHDRSQMVDFSLLPNEAGSLHHRAAVKPLSSPLPLRSPSIYCAGWTQPTLGRPCLCAGSGRPSSPPYPPGLVPLPPQNLGHKKHTKPEPRRELIMSERRGQSGTRPETAMGPPRPVQAIGNASGGVRLLQSHCIVFVCFVS